MPAKEKVKIVGLIIIALALESRLTTGSGPSSQMDGLGQMQMSESDVIGRRPGSKTFHF